MDRLLEATYRVEQQHFWWKGLRGFVRPLVAEAIAGRPNPRILDCGCGTGANLIMLGEYGHASGFDVSFRGLELAHQYGQRRVAQASIARIPFGDASFDLVTAFDVLYSLSEEEEAAALSEIRRAVRRSCSRPRRSRASTTSTRARASVTRSGERRSPTRTPSGSS